MQLFNPERGSQKERAFDWVLENCDEPVLGLLNGEDYAECSLHFSIIHFMKYTIVDDDETARLLIDAYARAHKDLQLHGSFEHPLEAVSFINNNQPDLLFLDIEMPLLNGIDFLRSLKKPPLCIFITSHPEFAIEAFELFALDYILKPITEERFNATIARAQAFLNIQQKAVAYEHKIEQETIIIQEGYETHRVQLSDILYLEALKDYTRIFTKHKNYITLGNLSRILEGFNIPAFTRVHRSYAVNSSHINSFADNNILIQDTEIPVGKTYRSIVNEMRKH